ncbi:hypothetical protein NE865_07662 [Phthorimaea operculella]|nr:hypothetical protein NE865_07662 [Phthorimaea operculella]
MLTLRLHLLPVLGLLFVIESIISLKLLELRVPSHVPVGAHALLTCTWELGARDVLYSVKWYKDGREFFRYVPRDLEPRRKFALPGVEVQNYDSSGGNLTLAPAVLESAGRYRCEVSGERPLFPTVSDHADMTVVVLPDHGPIITGLHPRYRPGDHIRLNCTSGYSKPATRLTWYINGEPAPADTMIPALPEKQGELERSSLTLDFVVKDSDFKQNALKVKACYKPILVHQRGTHARTTLADTMVPAAPEKQGELERSSITLDFVVKDSDFKQNALKVKTVSSYQKGANLVSYGHYTVATSGYSKPATRLTWYINGEPAPSNTMIPALPEKQGELERSSLTLEFVVKDSDFKQNALKVKVSMTFMYFIPTVSSYKGAN